MIGRRGRPRADLMVPPEVKEECVRLYLDGWTLRALAKLVYVTPQTIANWLQAAGVQCRPRSQPRSSRPVPGGLA